MTSTLAITGWLAALCTALVTRHVTAARSELIARACHELRGPITAARLGLELGARLGELSAARLRAVEQELARAALALEDLGGGPSHGQHRRRRRWMFRPGSEGRTGDARPREAVSVGELLAQSLEAWRAPAWAAGVELRLARSCGIQVRCDRVRLAQAMGNLIANAIEHGGGVVELRARADAGAVRIEVTDAGPGLPAPVAQLTRHARSGRGARGRGLAIASAIAAQHGGRISAAPSERGARLVLELPACVPGPAPAWSGAPE